jgi:uncharacterized protein YjbI with pentapeptide repeats
MNEKSGPVAPQGLGEASASFAPAAPVPPSDPMSALGVEELRGQDLRRTDLANYKGLLLPKHLAGSDLTGNETVPPDIAKFPALEQVKAISGEARKVFIGLLAACLYSWLVIGKTHDVELILNTASSPLPVINTPIPIAGFYVVGAAILAAVYCYLHFYLQRLWRTLGTLPAIFPDGAALDDKTDPWLLANLVRPHMSRVPARPLGMLEHKLSVLLAWCLVPLTLFALWARYLPAHDIDGLIWLAILIAVAICFGRHTFYLARAILRREAPAGWSKLPESQRVLPITLLRGLSRIPLDRMIVWGFLPFFIVIALSLSSLIQSPRNARGEVAIFSVSAPWGSVLKLDKSLAKILNFVGIRTYADLREVEVAQKPEGWDGKDWSKIKKVDLRGRNLAFADAVGAFLANADLRGADLAGANLSGAQLQGADLDHADLRGAHAGFTQLQGADLRFAQLQGALLFRAQLQGAVLSLAQLQGALLSLAQLQGADLSVADLAGAYVSFAQLQGADLSGAQLRGADLLHADLHGADLHGAGLQGADLSGAQLQGADLRKAGLWRALVSDADWDLADLRNGTVEPMTKTMIAQVSANITDESLRRRLVEHSTKALGTDDRPSRPDFPDEWRSQSNVMFNCDGPPRERIDQCDPAPLPFPWGLRKWATEQAYDRDLADFLGDLACRGDVPEAQTRGLALRSLNLAGPSSDERDRLWPKLFAARVSGPDCPPAKELPEDMRRQLEQLAARSGPSKAPRAIAPGSR